MAAKKKGGKKKGTRYWVPLFAVVALLAVAPSATAYPADRHGSCSELGAYRYHGDHFDRCMYDGTGYATKGWYPVAY